MLRNRSRAVTSKQALMADHNNNNKTQTSQYYHHYHHHPSSKTTSSFFGSPRFKAFFTQNDTLPSPTSILDAKPFFSHTKKNQPQRHLDFQISGPKGIGLALLNDPFDHDHHDNTNNNIQEQNSSRLLLGYYSMLRVQIPTEFGTKTWSSHVRGKEYRSPTRRRRRGIDSVDQHSEEHTCVISHGPVPTTTHIFDNCVVEVETTCGGGGGGGDITKRPLEPPRSFLSFCHTCNKNLLQKIDIYIYRGEKAFCSRECRYQEMVLDGMAIGEFDDHTIRDCF